MGEESSDTELPDALAPEPPEPRLQLAKLLGPALERILKSIPWRRHAKLSQECRAALEKLNAGASAAPNVPGLDNNSNSNGKAPFHPRAIETFLFDGPLYYPATDAETILQPLVSACDSQSAKLAEPALDCIQKLISHGYLRGEVDAESGSEFLVLVQMMDNVCKCQELGDEQIELLVLKTLLTAVTSTTFRVHGDCLLKAVRTCYNMFLGSKAAVNQTTAKASLTQMLVIVFRRMEADSSTVPVQPIVVTDLMEPSERASSDSSTTLFVQNFITRVVQDIEIALTPAPSFKSVKHDGAFEASVSGNGSSTSSDFLDSTDRDMLDAKYWEFSMYKNALEGRRADFDADSEKDGDSDVQIGNKLRRDAFLVFRALCKLSMKNTVQEGAAADNISLRGKIVALELLKLLLENAGAVFRTSDRFLGAIKQYLCLSLLRNSAIHLMNIFQLSCSIFMSLLARFRAGLKEEIGVFFPMIVLRVLENVAQPNYQQKMIVIRFLDKLCVDSQILVDIFVNYDCDVESSNMFERLIYGLLKTAQGVPPGVETSLTPVQDAAMKLAAMKTLVGVLRSMGDWANRQLRISDASYAIEENGDGAESRSGETHSELATFEQRRAYKLELQEGISLFNRKPSKGIEFLINAKKIGGSSKDIASFLMSTGGLDKTMIGDYLGGNEDLQLKVMHAYVDSFNFQDMEFDEGIRRLLQGFRLPGEAQKIDRIMEKFAERFCKCNPRAFTSADTAYVLAYSVILLNTDAHNPMVKSKMTKEGFIKNNRGIDDSKDLPEEFMSSLYDRIVKNEIKMKADNMAPANKPASGNRMLGIESILNIVIRKPKEDRFQETSDEIIRNMQQQLKAKAGKSGSVYYTPSDVEILRPMVEVTWAPMLAAFSVPLEKSEDEVITFQCLEGFRHAIHVTSVMSMRTERDAFVTSLAKFTSLHSPADIKQKNIDAIKAIISIADEDGNYLQEAWEHVLTCVSRFEHLHLIGEGSPPDATFFASSQGESEKAVPLKSPILPVLKKKVPGKMQYAAAAARRGSYESAGVGGNAAGAVTAEQMNNLVSNLNMLEQIGSFEMNKIFTRSDRLNSEAIVDFVKALCKVSLEEFRSATDPRVFSLTKIVEISHFNMNRIRLVWSKMWNVLSDYFVAVGCADNLSIAMYAMDSLRQLAMKFLEREELANYNFQNQFMKPFVVVMRKSNSVEIRELVIRCMSQMVFARVKNVKSGWKIMFMVFTTAATDEHKSIVLLAFETIEKIVREYFPYITETETTTFTDCVNCLIAFTNSRFNNDVSLNAIAFLRFCAHKLAEGELGAKEAGSENGPALEPPTFTDRDDHLHFWFPLLAGLSELTFDPRPEIRKSALEVLFDILRSHGHMFSPALWERVFDSVLLPLFDYVRRAVEPSSAQEGGEDDDQPELEMDAWLYETCTLALQLVVDLFVKFYPVVAHLLGRILLLLTGFLKRPHQSLAAIGVAAFVRLMSHTGHMFTDEKWEEVLGALQEAAAGTLPEMSRVMECLEDIELQRAVESRAPGEEEDAVGEETARLQAALSDFKCRTAVQLLLVQAINDLYTNHGGRLSAVHTLLVLDTLHVIAANSHGINSDIPLRARLHQMKVATQLSDPPLLRLESESYHAYLNLLQMLPVAKPELGEDGSVEKRLVELCEEVLQVYLGTATGGPAVWDAVPPAPAAGGERNGLKSLWSIPLSSSRKRELAARAPLVVSTLQAVSGLRESSFKKYLFRFFPLLATLISCEHGSEEVQLALSDMFSSWIGPLLLQP